MTSAQPQTPQIPLIGMHVAVPQTCMVQVAIASCGNPPINRTKESTYASLHVQGTHTGPGSRGQQTLPGYSILGNEKLLSVIFLKTPGSLKNANSFLKSFFEIQKRVTLKSMSLFPNCSATTYLVLNLDFVFSLYLKAIYRLDFIILLSDQEIIGDHKMLFMAK